MSMGIRDWRSATADWILLADNRLLFTVYWSLFPDHFSLVPNPHISRYNRPMHSSTPVTKALDVLEVEYVLHLHENTVRSLEQAARERNLSPSQIIRSLLFSLTHNSYVMLLVPGPDQISWQKLRRHLDVSRVTMATPEQVKDVTGYEPGAVSPYGLPRPLRILVDQRILEHEIVSVGAGIRNAGIILKRKDLLRSLEIEIGDWGVKTGD